MEERDVEGIVLKLANIIETKRNLEKEVEKLKLYKKAYYDAIKEGWILEMPDYLRENGVC